MSLIPEMRREKIQEYGLLSIKEQGYNAIRESLETIEDGLLQLIITDSIVVARDPAMEEPLQTCKDMLATLCPGSSRGRRSGEDP